MGTLTGRLALYKPAAGETGWGEAVAGEDVNANFDIIDAGKLVVATKTAAYTLTANDDVIIGDATSASFVLTLPTAVGISGKFYWIKRINSGANTVTVDGNGAQTIDGAATYVLSNLNDAITIVSNGSNWVIV